MKSYNPHASELHIDWDGSTHAIPEWFSNRELSRAAAHAILCDGDDGEVVRETEKAVRVVWETEAGTVGLWVPKSILVGPDELREAAERAVARRELNDRYYRYLRQTAKDNGVKLGSVRKWDKIRARLAEAGVAYMGIDEFAAR